MKTVFAELVNNNNNNNAINTAQLTMLQIQTSSQQLNERHKYLLTTEVEGQKTD